MNWILFVWLISLVTFTNGRFSDEDYASVPPIFHLDSYERCLRSNKDGLYCFVTIQLEPLNSDRISTTFNKIQNLTSDRSNFRYDLVRHGICASTLCSREIYLKGSDYENDKEFVKTSISNCYNSLYYRDPGLKGSVTKITCDTNDLKRNIGVYDVLVGTGLVLTILLVLFASVYDSRVLSNLKRNDKKPTMSEGERYLQCFSLPRNWESLLSRNRNFSTDRLGCLDGVRCYLMLVEIVVHTVVTHIMIPTLNPHHLAMLVNHPFLILFFNSFATQIFTILAGWLLAYNSFKAFERSGKVDYVRFIGQKLRTRYFRFIPALLCMVAINGTWLYHLPRGANWENLVGVEYRNCRYNGWLNLLFINNFFDIGDTCMFPTWEIAVDFQLYLVALILLTFIWKHKEHAKRIFGICLAIGVTISLVVNFITRYDIFVHTVPEQLHALSGVTMERYIYYSPYASFGCCVIGLIFGYTFYLRENKKNFTAKKYRVLWAVVSVLPIGISQLQAYFVHFPTPFSRLENAVVFAFLRNLYPVCVASFIFGLSQGLGGFLSRLAAWPPLQIFGKLTYGICLVHMSVLRLWAGELQFAPSVSVFYITTMCCGIAVVSIFFAGLLYLFVELPFRELHDAVFIQRRSTIDKNQHKVE